MASFRTLTLFIALCLAHFATEIESTRPFIENGQRAVKQDDYLRLPGDLRPTWYNIRLLPFIEEGNFTTDGFTEIWFDCVTATANITLNSANIQYDQPLVTVEDVTTESRFEVVALIDEQQSREMVTFQLGSSLQEGHRYKMSFTFTSILSDDLNGFYRSSYVENGVKKYLAVTQFESRGARRAFPCFDEPNMKANFSITLGRKKSMFAASNMVLMSTIPIEGMPDYEWDIFDTTPIMSSYLVVFLVSEFSTVETDPSLSNVQFRIYCRPELTSQMSYAANVGPRLMEFFESYLGIDYPLYKEDLAGIPDFAAGAMENWGLITYRESRLAYDPKTSTEMSRTSVALVTSHELAHQWFGNLVTLDWWNVIWLNEGFARYMEGIGVDGIDPTFHAQDVFVVSNMHSTMKSDAVESSKPMTNDQQNSPTSIVYDKGASVIRMAADMIGQATFQRGLTRYLTKMAYSNAMEDDLWNALDEQASIDGVILPAPLAQIMHSWTQKINYPLVRVTRDYGDSDGATVTQERFLINKNENSTDPALYLYWIHLTFTSNFSTDPAEAWMTDEQASKRLVTLGAANDQWVLFNVDQQGYYRVAYDETNYGLIADQLIADHRQIGMLNRAQLLDDAFNLALADVISYTTALDLTLYLKYEREYVPWSAVLSELDYIDIMLFDQSEYGDWKNYLTSLVGPYYNIFGFEETSSDTHLTIYSRIDALNWACRLKISDCVNNVKTAYGVVMSEPNTMLSPNQRDFILCAGVENGGSAEWEFAFTQYKLNGDRGYFTAMACTRKSEIIYNVLEMMLNPDSGILTNDINELFKNLAANPLGNSIAFNFLITRWDEIVASLGTDHMPSFYSYIARRLNTQDELDKYTKLRDDHLDVLGNSSLVQDAITTVQSNVDWLNVNKEEIGTWLQDPSTATALPSTLPPPETNPTTMSTSSTSTTTSSTTSTTPPSTTNPTPSTTTPAPTQSSGSRIQETWVFSIVMICLMKAIHFQ